MATDLSRPRELLGTVYLHCEAVLPSYPAPDQAAVTSVELKNRLAEWSQPCGDVVNAMENAATWFDRLGRPDDAKQLREARDKLSTLWNETYANYNDQTKAFLIKQLPDETVEAWIDRLGNYNGSNLATHIRWIGQYARSLLCSLEELEAAEARRKGVWYEIAPVDPSLLNSLEVVEAAEQKPRGGGQHDAAHSCDFRSVHWYGKEYSFTTQQAACVQVLWEAWKRKTPEVAGETLIDAAGSAQGRVDLVFRGNPAWGTVIVPGRTKGSYRLAEPTGDSPKRPKPKAQKTSRRARK